MHKVSMFPGSFQVESKARNFLSGCSRTANWEKFPCFQANGGFRVREITTSLRARSIFLLESGKKRKKSKPDQQLKNFHPCLQLGNIAGNMEIYGGTTWIGDLHAARTHSRRRYVDLRCRKGSLGQGASEREVSEVYMAREEVRGNAHHVSASREHLGRKARSSSLRLTPITPGRTAYV